MNDKHRGMSQVTDKIADVAGGMTGRAAAKTAGSRSSDAFVKNAALGDRYEIEAARIAIGRTRNEEVKRMAGELMHDHMTNTHQLQSALKTKETEGVTPPPQDLDERHRGMLDHLAKAPDGAFDKTYVDQQVLSHKETLDLMTGFSDKGDAAQLRSLARGAAPLVARHLRRAEALQARLSKGG